MERLCATKLNAKNLFKAIREHAILAINYEIGVLKLEPREFSKLDEEIRRVLIEKRYIYNQATRRLYLQRELLGRGLCNIEHKSELMLMELNSTLEKSKNISLCRATLKVEKDNQTHLALIHTYLQMKYQIEGPIISESLWEAQKQALLIKNKKYHERLYRACEHKLTDIKQFSIWLKKGNIKPCHETAYCFLQYSNVFLGKKRSSLIARPQTRQ